MEIVVDIVALVIVLFNVYWLFCLGCAIIETLGELLFARNASQWSDALCTLIFVLIVFAVCLGVCILIALDRLNHR